MSRDWESVFTTWAKGPSKAEQERAENAERQIRKAIQASDKLKDRNIKVFTQGSYRNRVNVRQDSDVDVGVVCFDTYFPTYADDNIRAEQRKSFVPATYEYATFKSELEEALVNYFGSKSVSRGSKSFDIKENTYRVESDVAAFFEHRRYTSVNKYLSGVEMIPDDKKPPRVKNWPEQHYANGVEKNSKTNRRYKRVVRIVKTLSNEMARKGYKSAQEVPSFLVECLVFNAPDSAFNHTQFKPMVRAVLANIFNDTRLKERCNEWGEVSELKYLFRDSQPWTREQAHQFISDAWDYIGYD
ncbi:nucleotidyltransferase [Vibrio parahaemolyticus]|uniref:nucleotidyltransferase domain-containing protein n=1 Tax=Vibrio parahaemolyticus TaxID=670 RepID=UPI0011230D50|nr:nucleotidyltransferase [Vibrio parahaemolyticus]MDF4902102.1 nucleotidyltransferase [Vibrio parahaemolyticus]TOP47104.1 nucleotidyltransferase [Vibrio parahaemolyticus]